MILSRLTPFESLTAACVAAPDRVRFRFLDDTSGEQQLTGAEILSRSLAFGRGLQEISQVSDRVLLPYPAGLDFVVGFLGCIAAKRIPVPANYPKPRRPSSRYQAIADNCQATVAVTDSKTLLTLDHSQETGLNWFSAGDIESRGAVKLGSGQLRERGVSLKLSHEYEKLENANSDSELSVAGSGSDDAHGFPDDLLFLQYTSGSTSNPKGVVITAENLFSNLRIISHGFGLDLIPSEQRVVCSWLPAYHDMGLVGVILSTLMHDGQAILMSPTSFLRRPALWLESIERYQASITVAPCFGYQWAASRISSADAQKMDLSCLGLAACGAEPISPAVLDRFATHFESAGFRKSAFYPCYGLAEATLMVSGDHRGDGRNRAQEAAETSLTVRLDRSQLRQHLAIETAVPADSSESEPSIEVVHCGEVGLDTELALLCQATGNRAAEGQIGEILVQSPSTAYGYWGAPDSTRKTFRFTFPDESQTYLRTGDLGFMLRGRLYVTGRRKELIIIAGQNFYPHDIEQTVAGAHSALTGLPSAAFAIAGESTEQLVLVQEVPRGIDQSACTAIMRKMRLAVASTHELAPFAVLLVRPASIPRTSSGKVQRLRACEEYRTGQLKIVAGWELKPLEDSQLFRDIGTLKRAGNPARLRATIENTLLRWVAAHTGESPDFVRPEQSFAEMGVDSLLTVQLAQEFEQWLGCRISPVAAWSYPTPAKMADFLLGQLDLSDASQSNTSTGQKSDESPSNDWLSGDLSSMLEQLEQMDEADAQSLLDQQRR